MKLDNTHEKRINRRIDIQKKCTLANQSDSIEMQTVDISIIGLGVQTDKTLTFKSGCELDVFFANHNFSHAELMWTKKDLNNTTRLGLKFLPKD
jgi:hypothetical protein